MRREGTSNNKLIYKSSTNYFNSFFNHNALAYHITPHSTAHATPTRNTQPTRTNSRMRHTPLRTTDNTHNYQHYAHQLYISIKITLSRRSINTQDHKHAGSNTQYIRKIILYASSCYMHKFILYAIHTTHKPTMHAGI